MTDTSHIDDRPQGATEGHAPLLSDPENGDVISVTAPLAARTYYWKPMAAYFRAQELAEICLAGVKAEGRVLDLGCGEGGPNAMLKELAIVKGETFGIDVAFDDLLGAKQRRTYEGLYRADGNRLPFGDGAFDAVVCNGVLSAIPQGPDGTIAEINRVLAPGGKLLTTVPTDHFVEVLPLPKIMAQFSQRWAAWYVRRLNRRLTHVSTLPAAEWQRRLKAQGLNVVVTRPFFSSRDGVIWNLLTLQVFRVFALFKFLRSDTLSGLAVRVLTALIHCASPGAEAKSEGLGYVLMVAEKGPIAPKET